MNNGIRGFHRSDKAWYAKNNDIRQPEISIGIFGDCGGCLEKFSVQWIERNHLLVPQLQVLNDAWKMFAGMKDLITGLAKYDKQNISADKFCEILLSLGFKDLTEYEIPEKYRPKNKKICFENIDYKPLFEIDDGGAIEIETEPGNWEKAVCNYIDEYHFAFCFGKSRCIYHIHQFAQDMEAYGRKFRAAEK
jgi:hypothetical protein